MNFKLTIRLDNGVLDTPADVAVKLQELALQLLRLPHALDCWPLTRSLTSYTCSL